MKPEELMIGDWVSYNGKHIRICHLISNHSDLNNACKIENVNKQVKPIPITSKILEKNGFKMKIEDYTPNWKMYILTPNFFLEDRLTGCYHFNGNHLAKIEYIHELQHVLRLCKIDKEIVL